MIYLKHFHSASYTFFEKQFPNAISHAIKLADHAIIPQLRLAMCSPSSPHAPSIRSDSKEQLRRPRPRIAIPTPPRPTRNSHHPKSTPPVHLLTVSSLQQTTSIGLGITIIQALTILTVRIGADGDDIPVRGGLFAGKWRREVAVVLTLVLDQEIHSLP